MHEHKSSFKCDFSCSWRLLVKVVAEVGRVKPVVALNAGVESKRGKSFTTRNLLSDQVCTIAFVQSICHNNNMNLLVGVGAVAVYAPDGLSGFESGNGRKNGLNNR